MSLINMIVKEMIEGGRKTHKLPRGLYLRWTESSEEYYGRPVMSLSRKGNTPSIQEADVIARAVTEVMKSSSKYKHKWAGKMIHVRPTTLKGKDQPEGWNVIRLVVEVNDKVDPVLIKLPYYDTV